MDPSVTKQKSLVITVFASVVGLFVLWSLFFKPTGGHHDIVHKAIVVLKGDSPVTGTVIFEQATRTGPVKVTGEVRNLDPLSKRGFHIHTLGDASNGCLSSGAHYNPFGKNHGGPNDSERHVGDLGNIESNKYGIANINFSDDLISLNGFLSIIGRTAVIHLGTDDLGKGGNSESLKTGNAGGRAACGVIGLA
jgi:Cu-Zn family superoxide dismutase